MGVLFILVHTELLYCDNDVLDHVGTIFNGLELVHMVPFLIANRQIIKKGHIVISDPQLAHTIRFSLRFILSKIKKSVRVRRA